MIPRRREDGTDVLLDWPEVEVGVNYSLPCPCGVNLSAVFDDVPRAYHYCGGDFIGGGKWEEPFVERCNLSSAGRKLCQITAVSV